MLRRESTLVATYSLKMEVTFRFRKELIERARRKAEASGTTIEQIIVEIIERCAAGEAIGVVASTKDLVKKSPSRQSVQSKNES